MTEQLTEAQRRLKGDDGMDGDIIRIIVHEVFEAYDSDNHYDDYESMRRNLEDAGVSDAWERDIDSDLKAARDTIETALALLDRIEALEAENERLRQIEAAARALVDTAFEVPGPDEHVYQAVRVDYFDMLATLLKMEGGATHA